MPFASFAAFTALVVLVFVKLLLLLNFSVVLTPTNSLTFSSSTEKKMNNY